MVAELQVSIAAALPRSTFVAVQPELAATNTSAGQVMAGGVRSRTITRWVQVLVLPAPSTTVQSTKFVPTGNCAGASLVIEAAPQLSLNKGVPRVAVAKHELEAASTAASGGQAIVGGCASRTTTSCWQVLVLPLESRAVQVTTFVPTKN